VTAWVNHHDGSAFRDQREVPGDKSLSHRALIFAAMANGTSRVTGLGPGRDVAATAAALARSGAVLDGDLLHSPGIAGLRDPGGPIDAGNSGTTMRLLAGMYAGRPYPTTLVGDESLQRRPMRRLVEPLQALGAEVALSDEGTAPVRVRAPEPLRGAAARVSLASAQVRTAFLLAALQALGESSVDGPGGFRDHSERWLHALGRGEWTSSTAFRLDPGPLPTGEYPVPGDPSSAAYLWGAAALVPHAEVTTPGVSLNPGRIGALDVLAAMGAEVEIRPAADLLGDPVGDVTVRGAPLRATVVGGELAVAALDELPLLAVIAAAADGTFTVGDAAELRTKESDRIVSTVAMVRALGGSAEATDDGFVVVGTGQLAGGTVDPMGDHRIAMAAAVAATATTAPVTVLGPEVAAVSWPAFYDELEALWSSQ
jgi:3-phosphoshikimate 1-carboxyvinyltransferase